MSARLLLALACAAAYAAPVAAADRHWGVEPGSADFNEVENWDEGIVPASLDQAIFGASTTTSLTFSSETTTVGAFTFNPSGAAYVFAVGNGRTLVFDGAGVVVLGGATPASVRFDVAESGFFHFTNAASAGPASIAIAGEVQFFDTSTAATSSIVINALAGETFPHLYFRDNATAGSATIVNNYVLRFFETSSAGSATITTGSAAEIIFFNSATAGSSRITVTGASGLSFFDDSSAGAATIETSATNGVTFIATSGAGTATITNHLTVLFAENSSAENATITSASGGENTAGTHITGQASGGNARFIFGASGFLNISPLNTGGTTVGSIEGSAASSFICLGGNRLTVGGNGSSTTFAGIFTALGCGGEDSAGGLTKVGAGTLTLTGSGAYDGATEVSAGTLALDGGAIFSGSSSFSIASGARALLGASALGANGAGATLSVGSLTVANGATLYLDDDAEVAATSLTLSPTSTFAAFFTTDTERHGRITVSQTAALAGSFVAYLDPATFAATSERSFLYEGVISGPVTGTFSSVTLANAPTNLFRVTPLYNSFDLLIELVSFGEFADPDAPNQQSVGAALDEIFEEGTEDEDLSNLIDTIGESSLDEIGDIYDAIAGATQAETDLAALKADDPWKQSVAQRVDAARSTGCTITGDTWCRTRYAQAPAAPVQTDAAEDPDAFAWLDTGLRDVGATSVWGRLVGIWGETDGGVSSPASNQRTYAVIAGADHVVDGTLLVGLAGQYVRTKADFDGSENESSVESLQAGAYVSYGGAETYLNANVSAIATHASTKRIFSVGAIDYLAAVRYPSTSVTAALELGTIFEVGHGYRLEPHAGLNFVGQFTGAYAEHGAGGLGLIVDPDDVHSLRSIVGARASRVYELGDRKIVPELRLEWRHEYLDRNTTFLAAFQGAPDVTFLVACEPTARDVVVVGGGLTLPLSGRVTGYLDAEGAFSEDTRAGTLSLGARATW